MRNTPVTKKISLMIIIHSLQGGGAERVLVNLLKGLGRTEFSITLVLYENICSFPMPENIQLKVLGIPAGRNLFSLGVGFLRKILALAGLVRKQKPDIIFSLLSSTNAAAILASMLSGTRTKVVVSEHTFPSVNLANERFGSITARVIGLLYPRANRVIAVSQGIKDDLQKSFGIRKEKIQVIYNPLDLDEIRRLGRESVRHPWFIPTAMKEMPVIVSAGRLTKQKGYPVLLRAFALVRKSVPCRLVILGEGPDRPMLERLISELDIEKDVSLAGFQENPFAFMEKAALFAMSSLYEGFLLVLAEAMTLGTPVVSTDCPSGPAELISEGINGLLVPIENEDALARAILRVLLDEKLRSVLANNGRTRAEDFAVNRIADEYSRVFREMIS
ncbi:MAG: glycosyl transferase [Thermodesulfovibrio sp.]|nr:glycosyl transferase [Thermodesulfovibrio sp.]